jgi:hypothetical protein
MTRILANSAASAFAVGWLIFAELATNTPEWLAVIVAIVSAVFGAVWWLSARLQRGDDTMKGLGKTMDLQRVIIEDHGKVLMGTTEALRRIEDAIAKLPCEKEDCRRI